MIFCWSLDDILSIFRWLFFTLRRIFCLTVRRSWDKLMSKYLDDLLLMFRWPFCWYWDEDLSIFRRIFCGSLNKMFFDLETIFLSIFRRFFFFRYLDKKIFNLATNICDKRPSIVRWNFDGRSLKFRHNHFLLLLRHLSNEKNTLKCLLEARHFCDANSSKNYRKMCPIY